MADAEGTAGGAPQAQDAAIQTEMSEGAPLSPEANPVDASGAETEELRALDSWSLACVHSPVPTRWNSGMHLGTLSLALKHQMVYYDVVQRKLPSALVLEDDALLPQDLWELYAAICLPTDAGVFFLGSYAERRDACPTTICTALAGRTRMAIASPGIRAAREQAADINVKPSSVASRIGTLPSWAR